MRETNDGSTKCTNVWEEKEILAVASGTPQPPTRCTCGLNFKILRHLVLELSHLHFRKLEL